MRLCWACARMRCGPELRSANARLLEYVKNGGTLIVQYNLQNFDRNYGPYPFTLGLESAEGGG